MADTSKTLQLPIHLKFCDLEDCAYITKILQYFGNNTVFQILEICRYVPVCDVS